MVRDIESLIEFLYLKSIDSPFDFDRIVVNPKSFDNLVGKICIINDLYDVPDLCLADEIINRFNDKYIDKVNQFIQFINIDSDDLFVTTKDNLFYFGSIPSELIYEGNCFDYLRKQQNLIK